MASRKLILVTGPTAVGKSEWCLDLAIRHGSPVISCDSRQIYREMTIGTAVPSPEQLSAVRHHFIQTHTIHRPYTAGMYETEALELIGRLFEEGHGTLVMTGGTLEVRHTLRELCEKLEPHGFLQVHRCYVVSCRYIFSIEAGRLIMDDRREIPISRYRLAACKEAFQRSISHGLDAAEHRPQGDL